MYDQRSNKQQRSHIKNNLDNEVRILNHFANPPLVANCTPTSLTCQIAQPSSLDLAQNIVVFWTFRGENVSKLTDIETQMDSKRMEWKLILSCPTLEYSGSYTCNAHHFNHSSILSKKEAVVQVYVPVSVQTVPSSGILHKKLGLKASLKCKATGFPKTFITWYKLINKSNSNKSNTAAVDQVTTTVIEANERIKFDSKQLSETVQESTLSIDPVQRLDEGARNAYNNESESGMKLMVLDSPRVKIDRIETLNSRTLIIHWNLDTDGNSPVKKVSVQVKNLSEGQEWMDRETNLMVEGVGVGGSEGGRKTGSFVVGALSPATSYSIRLEAVNDVGTHESSAENITTPSDVPSQISEIHVLGKTNETILIGWKRPVSDNGSVITQYQMELRNSREELVSDQMMEVESNPAKIRSNHMYIFVNLSPATRYSFRVRPCSLIGCSNWTAGFGVTSDGWSDPPRDVRVTCYEDRSRLMIWVQWLPPIDAKGTITGYNVSLEGHSQFRNEENQLASDNVFEERQVIGNSSLEWRGEIRPNTNYTVRVCTINKSGCGSFSHITGQSMVQSPIGVPSSIDPVQVSLDPTSARKLSAKIVRVSERNGTIKCYKLVIIRLPSHSRTHSDYPFKYTSVNITNYEDVHSDLVKGENGDMSMVKGRTESSKGEKQVQVLVPPSYPRGYVAEEFPVESVGTHEVSTIIGDNQFSTCHLHLPVDPSETDRLPRRVQSLQEENIGSSSSSGSIQLVTISPLASIYPTPKQFVLPKTVSSKPSITFDGPLAPETNYTGYLEVQVIGSNGQILSKQSDYFPPILTGSASIIPHSPPQLNHKTTPFAPILASIVGDSANAIAFGVVSGLALVFLLLMFVLCFLSRKVSQSTSSDLASHDDLEDHGGFGHVTSKKSSSSNSRGNNSVTNVLMSEEEEQLNGKWITHPVSIQDLPPLTYIDGQPIVNELHPFPLETVPEEFVDDDVQQQPFTVVDQTMHHHHHCNNTSINSPGEEEPMTIDDRYADVHL